MEINNWDKWQTFRKDRGTPPWIKVYRNLLSNEQWVDLTDSEKGQLISIWILAADKNGQIPDNPKMIQRMAMLESPPNINKFIELGFLSTTCQPPVNQAVTDCPQLDAPEESRAETEQSKIDSRFDDFWIMYDKNVNKPKCKAKFERLSKKSVDTIFNTLPKYINSTPDKQFRKAPLVYLNNDCWNDEIVIPTNKSGFNNQPSTSSYRDFPL